MSHDVAVSELRTSARVFATLYFRVWTILDRVASFITNGFWSKHKAPVWPCVCARGAPHPRQPHFRLQGDAPRVGATHVRAGAGWGCRASHGATARSTKLTRRARTHRAPSVYPRARHDAVSRARATARARAFSAVRRYRIWCQRSRFARPWRLTKIMAKEPKRLNATKFFWASGAAKTSAIRSPL